MDHHTARSRTRDGTLLACERRELIGMWQRDACRDDLEDQSHAFLTRRGAASDWELRQRQIGNNCFLVGNHRLISCIQAGDTYEIFEAENLFTGRVDALKVLPKQKATAAFVASHMHRTRVQSSIGSAQLLRVFDAACFGTVHYAVTEYIQGLDLLRAVRAHGPLSIDRAAACGVAASLALEAIHMRGLVHAGLRPTKILLADGGPFKLVDVGAAVPPAPFDFARNSHLVRMEYLSPEAIRGETVNAQSDIYLLGCVLYFAVTGRAPFRSGATKQDTAHAHCALSPRDPRELRSGVDDDFVEILGQMMAKDPARRIPNTHEVALVLARWLPAAPSPPSQAEGME